MRETKEVKSLFLREEPTTYYCPEEMQVPYSYEILKGQLLPSTSSTQIIAGYKASEIDSIDKLYEMIHPSDLNYVAKYSIASVNYINDLGMKVLLHQTKLVYRVKGKGGKQYHILRHGIVNGVSNGLLVSNITKLTDVSWLKPRPGSWQLIGPNTSSFDFQFPEIGNFKNHLSEREIQILKLVARGFQSNDISQFLKISRHTVDTHRRNMIRKLEVSNSMELVSIARDMGVI